MLGEKLTETVGKVTGTRVLSNESGNVEIEISFQGMGKVLGLDVSEMGTYIQTLRPTGHIYGKGQGVAMSASGDSLCWHGFGVGQSTGKGLGAKIRYAIDVQTTSQKWSRLNGVLLVGEWEIDENGNAKGAGWEWK